MPKARARVLVSGIVQGVFFRAHTREQAKALGLTGFVRNLRDGSVEAVFEGEQRNVEEMAAWCRGGPAGSRVEKVDVKLEEPTNEFDGFSIRY